MFPVPDFPIKTILDELFQTLKTHHVILSATTGSGKTTIVPLSLLEQPWLSGKKIIMLEPRRPAARMAARRMAALYNEDVGETIGYQVRFERKTSNKTRIEVLTEGLLLKRLQSDPVLADVGLVIFDEFHERNLVADLSLALCLDVCQALRDDLRLLVMSASLESGKLTELLDAKTITAEGRLHPVTIHYANQDYALKAAVQSCLPLIAKALSTVKSDVLVFLPGRREIVELFEIAKSQWGDQVEILMLYGELGGAEQDRVLNPAHRTKRRLILSTDIAETSLTIEGVEAVVDAGRTRKPFFQANSGLTRLETRWVSKASALQRAGRAGRLGPGHCFRAWTESHQQRLEENIAPEILQADLANTVLELAAWGVSNMNDVNWLDTPPKAHWQQAWELLSQLQAIDKRGQITALGKSMSTIPVHPRLAHMLLTAEGIKDRQLVTDIAALLSDRDPLLRQRGTGESVDIRLRLSALADWRKGEPVKGFDISRLKQLDRLSKQFLKLISKLRSSEGRKGLGIGAYLAMAYPDRVARRRLNSANFLLRNGKGVVLPEEDALAKADYIVVADLDAGQREGRVWLAAEISINDIEWLFADQINHQRIIEWDKDQQKVVARQRQLLGELVLIERQVAVEKSDPVSQVVLDQLKSQGLSILGEQKEFEVLRARIATMRKLDCDGDWPEVSDAGLIKTLDYWLLPWIENIQSLKQARKVNLVQALQSWLGWDKQQQLNQLLPELFSTPAGTKRSIEYRFNESPFLRVPLQEMLGESDSPTLANGQLKLVLQLLSPAGRPLQVTQDLSAFWKNAYHEVKKEMRGRYPKHVWPDDPVNAQATRFTKRHTAKK